MFHDEVPVIIISLDCSHQLGRGIILVEEKFLLEKPFLKHVHFPNGIQRSENIGYGAALGAVLWGAATPRPLGSPQFHELPLAPHFDWT